MRTFGEKQRSLHSLAGIERLQQLAIKGELRDVGVRDIGKTTWWWPVGLVIDDKHPLFIGRQPVDHT